MEAINNYFMSDLWEEEEKETLGKGTWIRLKVKVVTKVKDCEVKARILINK